MELAGRVPALSEQQVEESIVVPSTDNDDLGDGGDSRVN